ncbi:MAG: hypothetical protein ACQEVA_08275 [Myxococcota bacterium]
MKTTDQNTPSKGGSSNRDKTRLVSIIAIIAITLISGGLASFSACGPEESDQMSRAKEIDSRDELVGGPTALGEVGDYLLENDKIRVVIEKEGYNSGTGLYGGSLIDADLQRSNYDGGYLGGNGSDTFGEYFPAFFLEVVATENVEVINDGSNGEAAIIEVSGRGGEFVSMLRFINQAMVNSYDSLKSLQQQILQGIPANSDGEPLVDFTVRYILEPGASHVRIESTLTNTSGRRLTFPNQSVVDILESTLGLPLGDFRVPTGSVLGFGNLNSPFIPGIGFDLRYGLERAYENDVELPGFPGQVTDLVASANSTHDVNYGFLAGSNADTNFVYQRDQADETYGGDSEPGDLLTLFYASGFAGVLTHTVPEALNSVQIDEETGETGDCTAGDGEAPCSYTFTNYLIIGDGDVAGLRDEAFKIREMNTTKVAGRVFDPDTGQPVGKNASLLLYAPREGAADALDACSKDGDGIGTPRPTIFSHAFTNAEGFFEFTLPPGDYCYRIQDGGRELTDYEHFEVGDEPVYFETTAGSTGVIQASIVDGDGQPIPAKLTVVGTHEFRGDLVKREYLYDLESGQQWRTSDLVPDEEGDPSTRRYVERVAYSSSDGRVLTHVRPGDYTLYFSRGPEYEVVTREVSVDGGGTIRANASLERKLDTTGYLNGDFHMHARGSIDSGLDYNERVISIAAEGVEVVVSSDHNYVSDYLPYIYRNALQPFLRSIVGVELTTFEFGHFNAFPLEYQVGSVNRGSVPWQRVPPQTIFDELRANGKLGPDDTIIQVNHPRDSILGYFSQFNMSPFTTEVTPEFLLAGGGIDGATAAVASPSGNAFMRQCKEEGVECRGDQDFETTFSWDFDAIEIFNGKRLELLRHFRIPYGEGEWPEDIGRNLVQKTCDEQYEGQLNNYCSDNNIPDDECNVQNQNISYGDWCPFTRDELHLAYPKGEILCDDGEVAFEGGLDDWYNLLNYPRGYVRGDDVGDPEPVYKTYTATANSDSHKAGKPEINEPGNPRNFFWVGPDKDDPLEMGARGLVDAVQQHRVIATNGPFIEMQIGDAQVGQTTQVDSSTVPVTIEVRALDWVGADRFRLIANGEPVEVDDDESPTFYEFELDENGEFETTVDVEIDKDTWFVVEVEGDQSMFPIYTPQDIPPQSFEEAIGSLAGSFGFGGGIEGLGPEETFQVKPFGFTNPIWVVYDQGSDSDGEFTPPQPPTQSCTEFDSEAFQLGNFENLDSDAVKKRLDTVNIDTGHIKHGRHPFSRIKGNSRDVRTLFNAWGHAH